jgi:predicted RNA polymerase sigma factor
MRGGYLRNDQSFAMNKRLELLLKLVASGSADAFTWYGLAMEQRKGDNPASALATFEDLSQRFPDYLPQYLMAGQLLQSLGRPTEAKTWFERGIALASRNGDQKTLGELQNALAECTS